MTTLEATYEGVSGLFAPARSTAQSDDAKKIEIMREEIRSHLLRSHVMRDPAERVLIELMEVFSEASHRGWDGYGARPLDSASFDFAIRFLNALPSTAPLPEIGADTDGEVSFDWIFSERKALTVSIGPTGRCTFAFILGRSKSRGTEWIDDEIPAQISCALRQLARATTAKQIR